MREISRILKAPSPGVFFKDVLKSETTSAVGHLRVLPAARGGAEAWNLPNLSAPEWAFFRHHPPPQVSRRGIQI